MAEKIIQRIDGILKNINRVEKEIAGVSFDSFKSHILLQEAIAFSTSQIGRE